jgi:thiol:disulfide interchange protein DsbD
MKRLFFVVLAAFALSAAEPDPVDWKLVDGPPHAIKPGSKFTVRLVAQVHQGWHMYSLKPAAEGPVPTKVWVPDGQSFLTAGIIKASDPQLVQDPSFNMEVETYEGEASFTIPLRVAVSTNAGSQVLLVNASYQSCNNKICLPPKTVKVSLPIEVTR